MKAFKTVVRDQDMVIKTCKFVGQIYKVTSFGRSLYALYTTVQCTSNLQVINCSGFLKPKSQKFLDPGLAKP